MTPKEKAKELVDKFNVVGLQQRAEGYQCALIAVDEILFAITMADYGLDYTNQKDYWQQVKQEIELL
jgi:hypothetical protein